MKYRAIARRLPASEADPDLKQAEPGRRQSSPVPIAVRPPPPIPEATYLGTRIETCERMAEQSRDICARRVHLTMADGYRARLAALASRRP